MKKRSENQRKKIYEKIQPIKNEYFDEMQIIKGTTKKNILSVRKIVLHLSVFPNEKNNKRNGDFRFLAIYPQIVN